MHMYVLADLNNIIKQAILTNIISFLRITPYTNHEKVMVALDNMNGNGKLSVV